VGWVFLAEARSVKDNRWKCDDDQHCRCTTVNLSKDAGSKYTSVASDLQPGMRVTVTGQTDNDGNITASQILIVNNDPSSPNNPSPTGTEP
jgi:hypothetical protein